MKVMKFIYGDLTPAKVSDLKQACKQEVGFMSPTLRGILFLYVSLYMQSRSYRSFKSWLKFFVLAVLKFYTKQYFS